MKSAYLFLVGLLLTLTGCATRHVLFDDFNYSQPQELARNGWILRTAPGHPGIPGASWGTESFSLHEDPSTPGNHLLRMTSSTDGNPLNTHQTQLCHQRKYFEGTYAARVRFTDAPVEGPNGDQLVETFYLISPLKAPMDPDYSEVDFEYLPNGGWGHTGQTFFFTTWETFQLEPWIADNTSTNVSGTLAGWHTLVVQVHRGTVKYFVDGQQTADHGGKYYPEVMMSISFNLWFIRDHLLPAGDLRRWEEDIDWVFFRGGSALSTAAVEREVADLRQRSIAFRDTVPPSGLASPCNF